MGFVVLAALSCVCLASSLYCAGVGGGVALCTFLFRTHFFSERDLGSNTRGNDQLQTYKQTKFLTRRSCGINNIVRIILTSKPLPCVWLDFVAGKTSADILVLPPQSIRCCSAMHKPTPRILALFCAQNASDRQWGLFFS